MKDHQHHRPQLPQNAAAGALGGDLTGSGCRGAARRAARRSLIRAGLASIPIVLTLGSRPAWAQNPNPSGTVSHLPNYGAEGKWTWMGDHWEWSGFIDPNTGEWNGKGEDPNNPPTSPPVGGGSFSGEDESGGGEGS